MKHNLKGKRFGSLLVLDKNTNVKSKHTMWDCYCEDCGEFQTIRGASFISGNTSTCKCHRKSHNIFETLPNGASKMYDNKGNFTLIDTEDIEKLSEFYWYKDIHQRMKYWKSSKAGFLHKFVLDCQDSIVDHKEGDLDDHRKSQLRKCTREQNARNVRIKNRDLPIGVCYDGVGERYVAYIRVNGKQIRAYFKESTPNNAIKQRKEWEKKYYSDGFVPKYKSL